MDFFDKLKFGFNYIFGSRYIPTASGFEDVCFEYDGKLIMFLPILTDETGEHQATEIKAERLSSSNKIRNIKKVYIHQSLETTGCEEFFTKLFSFNNSIEEICIEEGSPLVDYCLGYIPDKSQDNKDKEDKKAIDGMYLLEDCMDCDISEIKNSAKTKKVILRFTTVSSDEINKIAEYCDGVYEGEINDYICNEHEEIDALVANNVFGPKKLENGLLAINEKTFHKLITIIPGAFKNREDIKMVVSDVIKKLGDSAFSGCENLELVEMDGVVSVGDNVFEGCKNIKKIRLSTNDACIQVFDKSSLDIRKKIANKEIELCYNDSGNQKEVNLGISKKIYRGLFG